MRQVQLWKPNAVCSMLVALLLLLAGTAVQAQSAGKARADRLVMGLITP